MSYIHISSKWSRLPEQIESLDGVSFEKNVELEPNKGYLTAPMKRWRNYI